MTSHALPLRDVYGVGAEAADDILRHVFRVEKALNPLHAQDFLTIVGQLTRALRSAAQGAEANILRKAIEQLDVDWANLSAAARNEVIRAATSSLERVETKVLPAVDHLFEVEAERVVQGTRVAVARQLKLRVGADMTARDSRIATFVRESQANFIRDEYGRRREVFGQKARDVVAEGLERGLGRDDLAGALASALEGQAVSRSRNYWEVVSMVFSNRARTFTQLGAFEDAAIEQFRFDAVLDETTSEICRMLHGRVFSVAKATQRMGEVERLRNPERIEDLQPFVRVGADENGNEVLFYEKDGRRRAVAQVDASGVGQRDGVGTYSRAMSTSQLEAAGINTPPLHGRCRSTIVAEV